jgi:hypothetical protein
MSLNLSKAREYIECQGFVIRQTEDRNGHKCYFWATSDGSCEGTASWATKEQAMDDCICSNDLRNHYETTYDL